MDSDYGIARELSDLQTLRSHYKPQLPPCLQVSLYGIVGASIIFFGAVDEFSVKFMC